MFWFKSEPTGKPFSREGLKKPFLQKSKPVNTGAPARFLSKKMGFFRGYLAWRKEGCRTVWCSHDF
ncbi:hypothetical protein F4W70_18115 [Pseudomonas cannabina]|nr:hypothetical protein F4W70_18115 [Pseudomonas cannabina]